MSAAGTTRTAKFVWPVLLVASGFLGLFLACEFRATPETKASVAKPPMVRVREVRPQAWQFVVRAHGSVTPRSESNLIPQVSGDVVWMSPSLVSGGFFGAGEPLLRIDPSDYEVNLESARASLARSKSEYALAEKELQRQKRLAKSSVASDADFDNAINRELVAAATLREARARLVQAERDMDRTEIRAPYTGRVRSEEVDLGQFVSRGDRLAKIYAVDFAEVRLPVPDVELQYLDLALDFQAEESGPQVRLAARFAGQDRHWQGRVVRTEGAIDPESRMIHIVARVDDPYRLLAEDDPTATPLAVGLFVEASVLGRRVDDVMLVPRRAFRDDDHVVVVSPDHRLSLRRVEVLRWEDDVAIVSGGLRDGELVCVSPIQAVVEGMQVRVAMDESDTASARARP